MQKSHSPLANSQALDMFKCVRDIIIRSTGNDINHKFLDPASYMFSSFGDFVAIQTVARAVYSSNPSTAVVFAKNWLRVCCSVYEDVCALNWISSLNQKQDCGNLLGDLWNAFCQNELQDAEYFAAIDKSVEVFSIAFENWVSHSSDLKKRRILQFLLACKLIDRNTVGNFIRLQSDAVSAFHFVVEKYDRLLSIENCNDLLKSFEKTKLMLEFAECKPWQRDVIRNKLIAETRDVIVSAPSGSDKTMLCISAIVTKIGEVRKQSKHARALFIVPEWSIHRFQEHIRRECDTQQINYEECFDFKFDELHLYNFVFVHWAVAIQASE
jgi:hypothetical protein